MSDIVQGNRSFKDGIEYYKCSRCRISKERTAENFSPEKIVTKDGNIKMRFSTTCRQCGRERVHRNSVAANTVDWVSEGQERGIKLWERQIGESIEAFNAFATFRGMYAPGQRRPTYNMVANVLGIGMNTVAYHSSQWKWAMRIDAYHAELDRSRLAMEEETRREMLQRHIQNAITVQEKATDKLSSVVADDLTAKDALMWLEAGIKIERQARSDVSMGTINVGGDNNQVNNVQININADQNQSNLAGILSILERSGALATVMNHPEIIEGEVVEGTEEDNE